ncbi:MAG TPA: hypothetical protein VJA47_02380 [archaeon]|nr:hypothetical protein [archaeon]
MKTELIGLLLIGILVISGCAGKEGDSGGQAAAGRMENSLPTVSGWTMTKIDVESPNGFQVLRGAYEKGGDIVVLSLVSGQSENVVKNQALSMAHEVVNEPKEATEGLVEQFVAKYILDDKFHVIYANSGKIGFVAVAESYDSLTSLLSTAYGNVLFEVQ